MSSHESSFALSCQDIRNVSVANRIFGKKKDLIIARPRRSALKFWFTVPQGFYALVTRHGAEEDYEDGSPVWPPGLHWGPPWLKVSHLVTMQSIVLRTSIDSCKTKDNVTVKVEIALMLRVMGDKDRSGDDPQNVRKFVHMVTATGLQSQLHDAQAEAVRTLVRSMAHTEVFGLRNVGRHELNQLSDKLNKDAISSTAPVNPSYVEVLEPISDIQTAIEENKDHQEEKDFFGDHDVDDELEADFAVEHGASITEIMKIRLNKQFKPQGVEITDVIIVNIQLPSYIQQQMSQKTMVISQNAEQRMQQKHDLLVLEQKEAIKTLNQSHKEQELEIIEDGRQQACVKKLQLEHERAQGIASLTRILVQMDVDKSIIKSESNLTVQRVRDLTKLEADRIKLEAEKKSAFEHTKTIAQTQCTEADADLKCAKLEASSESAIFQAEGKIAPKMKEYNDHYTNLQKISVNDSLAGNERLVITGVSGGDAANRLVLADAALSTSGPQNGMNSITNAERSRILSELAVVGGKAEVRINLGDKRF